MKSKRHLLPRLITGFMAFFRGFLFITQKRLWSFVLLPSLLSLGLGLVLLLGVYLGLTYLALHLWQGTGIWDSVYDTTAHIAAAIIALFVTLVSYQVLATLLVIPFLGPLLAKVEMLVLGREMDVPPLQDLKNIAIGLWFALRDLCLQLLALLVSLFLGPLQPVFMITITSHFMGRASFDFLLEKHSQGLDDRHHKTRTLLPEIQGLGAAQFLVLLIPIAGIFVAPASSLVGAALMFYSQQLPVQPQALQSLNASPSDGME